MVRNPTFSLTIITTIGLGIAACAVSFAVLDAVLLKPLAFPEPGNVVRLVPQHPEYGESDLSFALADLRDLASGLRGGMTVAAYDGWQATLDGPDGAERVYGATVTPEYFEVLGVAPSIGRYFTGADHERGTDHLVVLANDFWVGRFGGDPSVVGSSIRLNGSLYSVVGVAPPKLDDPRLGRGGYHPVSMWRSPTEDWYHGRYAERGTRAVTALGRIEPPATLRSAQQTASEIFDGLGDVFPETNARWNIRLVPLKAYMTAPVKAGLLLVVGMVVVLFAITLVNVANLFFIRSIGREGVHALELALGSPRLRVAWGVMLESAVLSLLGGAVGLWVASLVVEVLPALATHQIPRLNGATINGTVAAVSLALTGIVAVVCCLVAGLRIARLAPASVLSFGARTSRRKRRTLQLLLGFEAALTVVLVSVATLLYHSFLSMSSVDLGFRATGVISFRTEVPARLFDTDASVGQVFQNLESTLRATTGIEGVAFTNLLPFGGGYWSAHVRVVEGSASSEGDEDLTAEVRTASSGFFAVMGVEVSEGRSFEGVDRAGPRVTVVSERFARERLSLGHAVGSIIEVLGEEYRVIGVVPDLRDGSRSREPEATVYLEHYQAPSWLTRFSYVVVSPRRGFAAAAALIRPAVREVDRSLPVYELRTVDEVVSDTLGPERLRTTLMVGFAGLAFLLAAIGVYGVVSSAVAWARRDIGVRLALGARPRDIGKTILTGELAPVGIGGAIAVVAVALALPALGAIAFGVSPRDPVSLFSGVLVLVLLSLVGAWVPTRRAVQVDPIAVLREP